MRSAFTQLIAENQDRTDVQFVLHDARHKDFDEELLACRMDVAVAMFTNDSVQRQEEKLRKKGFRYEKLITLPAAACIGPGHRLYHQPEITMDDFKNERFIELPSRPITRKESLKAYLPIDPKRAIGTTHADARKDLLYQGLGFTLTYMHSAREREESKLRYVPIPGMSYTFYAFYDPLQPMTPEIARFLELLKTNVADYTI